MTNVLDVFPRRPLKLRSHGTSLRPDLWVLGVLLVFVVMMFFDFRDQMPALIDDLRLQGATPAVQAGVGEGGKCETNRGLTTCDFSAQYRTADGRDLERRLHYSTLFQEVDDKQPFTVRYDPRAPGHISSSWGVRLLPNRLLAQLLALALLGLVLIGGGWEIAWRYRSRKSLQLAGAQPTPIVARFVKVHPSRGHADLRFKWTYPATGIEQEDKTRFGRGVQPFWLDAAKTQMLALASPDGHAHLLDAGLREVGLTDEERRELMRFRAA